MEALGVRGGIVNFDSRNEILIVHFRLLFLKLICPWGMEPFKCPSSLKG
jgi:hypothetical protein